MEKIQICKWHSATEIESLLGEAYFIRAYTYFALVMSSFHATAVSILQNLYFVRCLMQAQFRCLSMDKLATLWAFVCRRKYLITLVVFVVIVGFLDENSIVRRMGYALSLIHI